MVLQVSFIYANDHITKVTYMSYPVVTTVVVVTILNTILLASIMVYEGTHHRVDVRSSITA